MIKRKNHNIGVNANVSIEPNAASSSNNNFNNNIYVQTPYPAEVKTEPSTFTEREVVIQPETVLEPDVRTLILETYASILLNKDKALISNLISKQTIIIPLADLVNIIRIMTDGDVEIRVDEDCSCCAARVSPIKKIEAIKIIKDNVVVTDFKQVFNKEYNELVNNYHVNLKYVVD
ncbi:hypothetical protein M9Y10_014817 [Tritrichomonas musculus]|uniref:Uncharacterized protein n=1 Tax=Tritrichomonas musculus TaxID=1915356 RepID=A0ABR2L0K6_9EUKA